MFVAMQASAYLFQPTPYFEDLILEVVLFWKVEGQTCRLRLLWKSNCAENQLMADQKQRNY